MDTVAFYLLDNGLWLLLMGLVFLYVYGTMHHDTWTCQGVPGPTPWPLLGNLMEVVKQVTLPQNHLYTQWQRTYGRVFGFFLGVNPSLVVTEADLIHELLVKHANNFVDMDFIQGMESLPLYTMATGVRWDRICTSIASAFRESQLKMMYHDIDRCSRLLVQNLKQKAQSQQVIHGLSDVLRPFSLDVMTGAILGLETNGQTEEGGPFVRRCRDLLDTVSDPPALYRTLANKVFPFVQSGHTSLASSSSEQADFLYKTVERLIQDNCVLDKKQRTSVLQFLVDTEAEADQTSDRRMTDDDLTRLALTVLQAGYETTATVLGCLLHQLALHPHVQHRVYQEVKDAIGQDHPTYESVSNLKYTEAAIRETFRLFPPIVSVDRRARETLKTRELAIPYDSGLTVPVTCLTHDPQLFPDPHRFLPDRFLEENRSRLNPVAAELPFGYGPRRSLGLGLVLLVTKMAVAAFCQRFRFSTCSDTPVRLTSDNSFGRSGPSDVTIKVKVEVRETA